MAEKAVNWISFADSLESKCSERVIRDRFRYAKKYQHCLFERDFSELNNLSECKQKLILKSLSALSKFVGLYQEFKGLMNDYGLKWASGKAEELLISRMNKVSTIGNVVDWIRKVEVKNPELKPFINFMLISGLRFEEALRSHNLIIELSKDDKQTAIMKMKYFNTISQKTICSQNQESLHQFYGKKNN